MSERCSLLYTGEAGEGRVLSGAIRGIMKNRYREGGEDLTLRQVTCEPGVLKVNT